MIDWNKKLTVEPNNMTLLTEAKTGSFWHWKRVYVLKGENDQYSFIRLNIFERIYANLFYCGIANFFSKVFADKKITFVNKDLNLITYNTSTVALDELYKPLEAEQPLWRGKEKIDSQMQHVFLFGKFDRKEWWGKFAAWVGSTGLNELIDEANIIEKKGVALDIGSGLSKSAIYLVQRGWTVVCLDYSNHALDIMKHRTYDLPKKENLSFVCSPIEEYSWPQKFDLVLASSTLPYVDPGKVREVMTKIYSNLKPNGTLIGNVFASKYVGDNIEMVREMGAWVMPKEDTMGHLLAGHGFKVVKCERGGAKNPHSILFIGKKLN